MLSDEVKSLNFNIDELTDELHHRDAIITDLTALNSKLRTKVSGMVQANTRMKSIQDIFRTDYVNNWPKVHADFINAVTKLPTMNMYFGIHPWDVDRTIPYDSYDHVVKWTTKGDLGVTGAQVLNTGLHQFAKFSIHKYDNTDYLPFSTLMDKQFDPDPPNPKWNKSGFKFAMEAMRWNHGSWSYADEYLWPHYDRTMNTYNARVAQYLFMLDNLMIEIFGLDVNIEVTTDAIGKF